MQQPALINRPVMRALLKSMIHMAFSMITDFNISGREYIPTDGPALIISNHFNFADPVALIHAFPRKMDFIGGTELPNSPKLVRSIPRLWGVYTVHRGRSSRDALMCGLNSLRHGRFLAIFPEGGSWANVLRPARPGTSLLGVRSSAPVIPVGLNGFDSLFPLKFGKRKSVSVNIGKPFYLSQPGEKAHVEREQLDEFGHDMMKRIAELVDPQNRGFYSDDPAIREAAKGTEIYPWDTLIEE
jgi:1-acyl-sn-glycerol-3-phosphate acyltransferase